MRQYAAKTIQSIAMLTDNNDKLKEELTELFKLI